MKIGVQIMGKVSKQGLFFLLGWYQREKFINQTPVKRWFSVLSNSDVQKGLRIMAYLWIPFLSIGWLLWSDSLEAIGLLLLLLAMASQYVDYESRLSSFQKFIQKNYLKQKYQAGKIRSCDYWFGQVLKLNDYEYRFYHFMSHEKLHLARNKQKRFRLYFTKNGIALLQIMVEEPVSCLPVKRLDDVAFKNFYLIPSKKNAYGKSYYINDGRCLVSLDQVLGDEPFEKLTKALRATPQLAKCYPEFKQDIAKEHKKNKRKRISDYIESQSLPIEAANILSFINENSKKLGFRLSDLNGKNIEGNDNYVKLKVRLGENMTLASVKKNLELLETKVNCKANLTMGNQDPWLTCFYGTEKTGHAMKMDEVITDGHTGVIQLGQGKMGPVNLKIPRGDRPLFVSLGGMSRGGKSLLAKRLILTLLNLQNENGIYDYQDCYVGTVKPEDYLSEGYGDAGIVVQETPAGIYDMLKKVDSQATERQQDFFKTRTTNIKEYNEKSTKKMGKILIVLDEYENALSSGTSEKTPDGQNLAQAIESLALKIAQEHGSRGVSMIVITQNFQKQSLGRLSDGLGSKFLGYANSNVWDSVEPTREISSYLKNETDRRGLFFVNAPEFEPASPVAKFDCGFIKVRTNYLDGGQPAINRKFETSAKFEANSNLSNIESEDVDWLDEIK